MANFDMFKAWQSFYQHWQQQEATTHTAGESSVGTESGAVAEASQSGPSLNVGAELQAAGGTGEPSGVDKSIRSQASEGTGEPEQDLPRPDEDNYTAEEYLTASKNFTKAKSKFRHALKVAALKAKVWGEKTYKEIGSKEIHFIHKQICLQCPALQVRLQDVDTVLKKCLLEAKYYRAKKKGQLNTSEGASASSSREEVQTKTKKQKRKKGAKPNAEEQVEPSTNYERTIAARKAVNKALLKSVEKAPSTTFKTGEQVHLMHQEVPVGVGIFMESVNAMYCKVAFKEHLDAAEDMDIELHLPVEANEETGRRQKTVFDELEEDDIFLWKECKLMAMSSKRAQGTTPASACAPITASTSKRRVKMPSRFQM